MPQARAAKLDPLTSVRFFAALYVVFYHSGASLFQYAPEWAKSVRDCGYTGVSFFFVLSGFILTYKYVGRPGSPRLDLRQFWRARIARIYPMYLVALIALAAVSFRVFGPPHSHREIASGLSNVLLLQAWWPPFALSWNFPGWSVSVEAFFYLLFPAIAVLLRRSDNNRTLMLLMALFWVAELSLVMAYMIADPDQTESSSGEAGFWQRAVTYSPLARLPEFLVGTTVGKIVLNEIHRGRLRNGMWWVGAGLSGLFALFAFHVTLPVPLIHATLAVPFFALTIYGLAHGVGWLSDALSNRWLVALGDASYSLYILQAPIELWFLVLLRETPSIGRMGGGMFLVYVAALIGVSLFTLRFIERPTRAWLRRGLDPGASPRIFA
jgi:peptidoglycan/LPS O-acetylase OafA/YrhL